MGKFEELLLHVALSNGWIETPEDFDSVSIGKYESEEDYGLQYFDSIYGLSRLEEEFGSLQYAIDWQKYGEDLLMDANFDYVSGTLYVYT